MPDTSVVRLEHRFASEFGELCVPWQAERVEAPSLLVLNSELAVELGLDPGRLAAPDGVEMLTGTQVPPGAQTVALAYAGHQFGGWSPRLGDGRALLLGELRDDAGSLRDLHLKGSGRTPFARGGDGKAAVGPMLREYVISEAMHALGIPTTRSLAVVGTGQPVIRDTVLPGAVLARVASSHVRVGTFQYAASLGDTALVRRLADHCIERHHRAANDAANPYLAFLELVVQAQARLVARWMAVGFVHGVMNTDNTTISGETIDYGPCAFIDAFDPAAVFSSIDHGGRYAFGNQPVIAQWNLARLAETLLPLLADDTDAAVESATSILHGFLHGFQREWLALMRAKLGLVDESEGDEALVNALLTTMQEEQLDYTSTFRVLASGLRGGVLPASLAPWHEDWSERLTAPTSVIRAPSDVAAAMDAVNPVYIPRNHLVEAALTAATDGDLDACNALLEVLRAPFDARPGLEDYAAPAPPEFGRYRTFCGT